MAVSLTGVWGHLVPALEADLELLLGSTGNDILVQSDYVGLILFAYKSSPLQPFPGILHFHI